MTKFSFVVECLQNMRKGSEGTQEKETLYHEVFSEKNFIALTLQSVHLSENSNELIQFESVV